MKNLTKKRSRSAAESVVTSIPIPLAPFSVVVGGLISTFQGLRGVFEGPINAEMVQLIELTTALRDQACGAPSLPTNRQ